MMLFLASLREFLARSFFFLEEAASDWIMLLRSLFDFSFFSTYGNFLFLLLPDSAPFSGHVLLDCFHQFVVFRKFDLRFKIFAILPEKLLTMLKYADFT